MSCGRTRKVGEKQACSAKGVPSWDRVCSQDDVACRIWRGREDADGGDVHARCDASAMWAAISLAVGSVEDASVSQWGGEDRKVSRGAELVFGSPRTLDELARPSRKLPSIYSILHHLPLALTS